MDKVTEASNSLELCLKFFRRFLPPPSNCPRKVSVIFVTCYAVHILCLIYLKCSVTGTKSMQTNIDSNRTPCNTPHGTFTSPVSISFSPAQKAHLFSKNSWFPFSFPWHTARNGSGRLRYGDVNITLNYTHHTR